MPRIRSVHPGLWTDEGFVSASPIARLLYIGIWTEADDIGCFEWKPVTLKMRLLPVDNADVAALMAELVMAGMLLQYRVNSREFGAIRNFCRFQRPKKPKSVHPTTPNVLKFVASGEARSEPDEDEGGGGSGQDRHEAPAVPKKEELTTAQVEQVPPKAEISPQMEDGGDKREEEEERKGEPSGSLVRSPRTKAKTGDADFDAFYAAYPRRQARDGALKAWRSVLASGADPPDIMAGLARHRFSFDPQFIPLPASWLRAGRWKDEMPPEPQPEPKPHTRNGLFELHKRREAGEDVVGNLLDEMEAERATTH